MRQCKNCGKTAPLNTSVCPSEGVWYCNWTCYQQEQEYQEKLSAWYGCQPQQ